MDGVELKPPGRVGEEWGGKTSYRDNSGPQLSCYSRAGQGNEALFSPSPTISSVTPAKHNRMDRKSQIMFSPNSFLIITEIQQAEDATFLGW